ncbi:MAG: hypothetical protein SF172_04655 [Burkholderiales bacterium]|nr:hypothetical protein [Burkholderiales bacterium]
MNIQTSNPTQVSGPPVTFKLQDKGSAHVSMTLIIAGATVLRHEETYAGSLVRTLDLAKGNYECTYVEIAFKTGALGPTYDSIVTINGSTAVKAKGSIAAGSDSDYGFAKFTLVVA